MNKCSLKVLKAVSVQNTGNGELGLPLCDHDSSYHELHILVNEIALRALSSDRMETAIFGTTFTLLWKCLTNELGFCEVVDLPKEENKENHDLIFFSFTHV